jgi:methionine synthase I (cobalamin-dependent)
VAGNIGPSGLFMPPVGDADPSVLEEAYAAQAKILAEGGADYISIETMIDLEEARIALRAARKAALDLPVSVTMVFEKKKRGFFTPMGNRPEDAARILSEEGADLVGANCSMGSQEMREMAGAMTDSAGVPVVMKPNAGLPETEGSRTVYRQDPEEFAEDLEAMVRGGVRAVGGCCGTDERFIAALRRRIDSM